MSRASRGLEAVPELCFVGFCERTRRFGVGVVSGVPGGFGSRIAGRAWRGLVCCQGGLPHRSVRLVERRLDDGWRGAALLDGLRASGDADDARRLLLSIDGTGRTAVSAGEHIQRTTYCRDAVGRAAASCGIASASAVAVMLETFDALAPEDLGERLMRTLEAGAGAAPSPYASACLRVYDPSIEYPFVDVTVDLHESPIAALRRAHDWLSPLYTYYALRGQDPTIARYPQWLAARGLAGHSGTPVGGGEAG